MLDLSELEQFAAFASLGTLSRVAEKFHISTPSVTRSMQHLEESFGVPLFSRGKNHIELNETGKMAAGCAAQLLQNASQTIEQVRAFEMRRKTIVIRSCAPAPLWKLLPELNTKQPGILISHAICQNEEVMDALKNGSCDIGILPFPLENSREFMQEHLFVCVSPDHELAHYDTLSFSAINGFNFLLRSELGFWDTLCREKMPASKFLVQTDPEAFDELVRASSLPCFSTDYGQHQSGIFFDRINIPLTDPEAHVTFYLTEQQRGSYSSARLL